MVAATETLGQVLTDPDGRTLYRYDVERTETIGCVDPRTDTRKPLLDPPGAALRPAPGLAGTLGTVTRSDGGDQVTYDGSPLYRSTADHRPADTNGVDLHWHVINPQKAPEPAATTR
jgi:predicted lipoprotein with Yx(FWY)xxD motif